MPLRRFLLSTPRSRNKSSLIRYDSLGHAPECDLGPSPRRHPSSAISYVTTSSLTLWQIRPAAARKHLERCQRRPERPPGRFSMILGSARPQSTQFGPANHPQSTDPPTPRSRCDLAPNSSCMHLRDCASSKDHAGLCVRLYEKLSPLLTPLVDLLWSLPAPSLQIDRQERKPDSLASETIRSKRQSAMDVKCHQNRRF